MTVYRPATLLKDLTKALNMNFEVNDLLLNLYCSNDTDTETMVYDFANGRPVEKVATNRGVWQTDPENTTPEQVAWKFFNSSNGKSYGLRVKLMNYDEDEDLPMSEAVFEYEVTELQ